MVRPLPRRLSPPSFLRLRSELQNYSFGTGQPPKFVLEVAPGSSAEIDVGDKRQDCAAPGMPEHWRFGEMGEHHGERLSGEHPAVGEYVIIPAEELPDGSLRGTARPS